VTKLDKPCRSGGESLIKWIHTGIAAPYVLSARRYSELEVSRGVAFTAEMVHPRLGVVGGIESRGEGGPAWFFPYDRRVFGMPDLETFVAQCRQDDEPLGVGGAAVEILLDRMLDEAMYTEQVVAMRRSGTGFLVRSFQPRTETNYGPHRGAVLNCGRVVLGRPEREAFARQAESTPHRLRPDAHWEMFNGEEWVRLLAEPALTPEQIRARVGDIRTLYTATADDQADGNVVNAGPLEDGMYLTGGAPTGNFLLVGDDRNSVATALWCQCKAARRDTVRFERWNLQDGLLASGALHGARRCRRLVTID